LPILSNKKKFRKRDIFGYKIEE
jgi:hypothetical protein